MSRVLRALVLWSNLLYASIGVTALALLMGTVPPAAMLVPVAMACAAAATGILNVRLLRHIGSSTSRLFALLGNLFWLGFLLLKPEYAHVALAIVVAAIPLANIVALWIEWRRPGWGHGHHPVHN